MYLHERDNCTAFRWDASALTATYERVSRKQGLPQGRVASLGFYWNKMKNIDRLWENTEKRFREHFDNKKTVWGGYAISFVSIALAILIVGVTVWRHREFTGETLELIVVLSLLGITSFVFCYFRKTAPIRVKFYTLSLVMALVPTYMLTFHPEATSRRYPYPEFNRAVEFVGIVFFGGGGLCVLYKDIMWHLKHKSKKKHSNTSRKPHKKQEKHVHC